jgi:hypothetical protein
VAESDRQQRARDRAPTALLHPLETANSQPIAGLSPW